MNKIPKLYESDLIEGADFLCIDESIYQKYFTTGKIYKLISARVGDGRKDYWMLDDENDMANLFDCTITEMENYFSPLSAWEDEDAFALRLGGYEAFLENEVTQ